jgi:hypothetical protein
LRAQIDQHVYRNDDWTAEELFENLGAFEASDKRLAPFIERLASADVVPDVRGTTPVRHHRQPAPRPRWRPTAGTSEDGGYPLFELVLNRSGQFEALPNEPYVNVGIVVLPRFRWRAGRDWRRLLRVARSMAWASSRRLGAS